MYNCFGMEGFGFSVVFVNISAQNAVFQSHGTEVVVPKGSGVVCRLENSR